MGLSSCKLPFPDSIIIIEAIVCKIKCKVRCNINGLKNPTMAMKIQNDHFAFHYTLSWLDRSFPFPHPSPQLDEGPMGEPESSFVDYQTTMVRTAKAIAVTVQEMVSSGESKRTDLGEVISVITSLPLSPGNQIKHQP